MEETKLHYKDSLYYEMVLTSKYFQMYGAQFFGASHYPVTMDEFAMLDVIYCNQGVCQRDLAKLILKDRANTGRLVESLERKGFVRRELVTRNNRPIKQTTLTKEGEDILTKITSDIKEELKYVHDEVSEEEIDKACETLKKLQKAIGKVLKTQI